MRNTNNATTEAAHDDSPNLLEFVLTALEVTGRLNAAQSAPQHPYFNRDTIKDFHIDFHGGGYVANLEFNVLSGHPNVVGTPDRSPFGTEREAFMAGARLLCQILTGSGELPFIVKGDELIVVAYCA